MTGETKEPAGSRPPESLDAGLVGGKQRGHGVVDDSRSHTILGQPGDQEAEAADQISRGS